MQDRDYFLKHLDILQSIISRMAQNSSSAKSYCITLVSAILVFVMDKGRVEFIMIAYLPILMCFLLDVYYLALEKRFRKSYNMCVLKKSNNTFTDVEVLNIKPTIVSQKCPLVDYIRSSYSPSILFFYPTLMIAIYIVSMILYC